MKIKQLTNSLVTLHTCRHVQLKYTQSDANLLEVEQSLHFYRHRPKIISQSRNCHIQGSLKFTENIMLL